MKVNRIVYITAVEQLGRIGEVKEAATLPFSMQVRGRKSNHRETRQALKLYVVLGNFHLGVVFSTLPLSQEFDEASNLL